MAILVDFSQVILASIFAGIGNHTNTEIDENTLRHIVLNSLRANRVKFKDQYGELVICVDGKNSWRRKEFPYYKASRRKSREESELDWPELFRMIALIKDEIADNFPYKVIHIDNAEADDVIGAVIHEYGTQLWDGSEKFLVLSGDKDYIQLHKYANVEQYNPVLKKFVVHSDPERYLVEHIIKGDKGDGIPNILSADNSIVIGERQKTMTAKRLEAFSAGVQNMDEETVRRFERNTLLIDLSKMPDDIRKQILEEYNKEPPQKREKLFNYFVKMKLKNLLTDIQDF